MDKSGARTLCFVAAIYAYALLNERKRRSEIRFNRATNEFVDTYVHNVYTHIDR